MALGLPHDLEIGKRTTTTTTSSYSLTKLVVFEGKFSMDVCPPVALYLVDRSWRIVLIVGKILFSMLRTQQLVHKVRQYPTRFHRNGEFPPYISPEPSLLGYSACIRRGTHSCNPRTRFCMFQHNTTPPCMCKGHMQVLEGFLRPGARFAAEP